MNELKRGIILNHTYEIIGEIGSGGGGVVFLARHVRLQADVVVKRIKDEVRGKLKSRQEADILKKLKHPYLPKVYDFIETEEAVYTVMDYISGKSLDEVMREDGRCNQKDVLKWAEQLGEAVAYLHAQKPPIIHSDIKPANIMLTKDGNICLIDFNISLAIDSDNYAAVGISARYSPPEQYRDEASYMHMTQNYARNLQPSGKYDDRTELLVKNRNGNLRPTVLQKSSDRDTRTQVLQYFGKGIDTRSDVYSLGATLYHLLAGQPPAAEFDRILPLWELNASVSEGLVVIIEKMMDVVPERRYQDGGELLAAVKNCFMLDQRFKNMRRRENGLLIGASACLVAGVLLIMGGLRTMRVEKSNAYYSCVQEAEVAVQAGNFRGAEKLLEEAENLHPEKVEAYAGWMYLLYSRADYEGAVEYGARALTSGRFVANTSDSQKALGDIYFLMANSYLELADYKNARGAMEQALDYHENNGTYYRDYAIILAKSGMEEAAKQALDTAVSLGIAEDSIYMVQGEIACGQSEFESALEKLEQVIALTADNAMKTRAILLSADCFNSLGSSHIDEEIALLENFRGQATENLMLTEYLADAYARKAKLVEEGADAYYEKALSLFLEMEENGYQTYQLQENIAVLYEQAGNLQAAEERLLSMLEQYADKYQVYKRLAYLEADKQQQKENEGRDYKPMKAYYDRAKSLYTGNDDVEMQMLYNMMQELLDGGWL